jgi:IS30 family transposase
VSCVGKRRLVASQSRLAGTIVGSPVRLIVTVGAANYRAFAARERYESFTVQPKEHKLVASSGLHDAVNEGLEQEWSPEQISARLTRTILMTRR